MEFRTHVETPALPFQLEPMDGLLFVGSCFADEIGRRFEQEQFGVVRNPFGTMYNPASVLHTVERVVTKVEGGRWKVEGAPRAAFLTLGTNHVYRLRETGEIVDNCQKRPAALFEEEELSVEACAGYLRQAVERLRQRWPDIHIVLTVSPIRYRKYGYHGSQLSKATLLLATQGVEHTTYFPAYELLMDELRDYRFYKDDMLHPSEQAVEYIWERLVESCFSERARQWLADWRPVKQALAHRPFDAGSEEYAAFMEKTRQKIAELSRKYPNFALAKQ